MNPDDALVVFQGSRIRRIWHERPGYFPVADIIEILTDSANLNNYWRVLKL